MCMNVNICVCVHKLFLFYKIVIIWYRLFGSLNFFYSVYATEYPDTYHEMILSNHNSLNGASVNPPVF